VTATFAGRVGREDCGAQAKNLADLGVNPVLAWDEDLPTGMIVTILSPDGERSFFTDRGANTKLCRADLPFSLLGGADLVHVSGYALFEAGTREAVLALLGEAGGRGIPFTVDAASHSFLAEGGAGSFVAWTSGAAICFCNADEAAVLAGTDGAEAQVAILAEHYGLVVVKRGADGALAGDGCGGRWSAPAPAAAVLDSSGAGDAFCAGYLAAHLRGEDIGACLRRGAAAGARAITTLGGRPS
jgi:sugar/nucleoside kinase (ribokinase family)